MVFKELEIQGFKSFPDKVKITFDVTCLFLTACMTFLCLGHISGLGIGTVAAAFTMGKTIGLIGEAIDKKVEFVSVLSK